MNIFPEKKLGFGLMRLPRLNEKEIDIQKTKELVDAFIEKGYTYFDTAHAYEGSEEAIREALVKRYPRDKFTLTNKMPWYVGQEKSKEEIFEESLKRCGVDYFDYYIMHAMSETRYRMYEDNDCWNYFKKLKEEGKIKHIGLSYHGGPAFLEELLTKYPYVEFVQLQINYLDWENPSVEAKENYEVCVKYQKPIIVMEPNKGGSLINLNETCQKILKSASNKSNAAYSFGFLKEKPQIKMVLSGMNTIEQVLENTSIFDDKTELTQTEKQAINDVVSSITSAKLIGCTSCHYCTKGCPMQIEIPRFIKVLNMYREEGLHSREKYFFAEALKEGQAPDQCLKCGQCEAVCPQHLSIISYLEEVDSVFKNQE